MQTNFVITNGKLVETTEKNAVVHVFTTPTPEEKKLIIQRLDVDDYDFDAALDPDEISRVEFEKDHTAIIWKQPHAGDFSLKAQLDVLSVGFFIHKNSLILIMGEDDIPFDRKIFEGVTTINDVLLKYFFYTIRQYLKHLKTIKQTKSQLESKLSQSMENKYFLQMFEISESLVYYINAIEANGAVLTKLHTNSVRVSPDPLSFTPQQLDYLEDTILENAQSARQAHIYSTVLSGLMDARGNIINNNMNVLLKNLTLINVIFLPLNLLASMGGMSEFTVMIGEYGINWRLGYFLFFVSMVVIGWLVWVSLKKYVGRPTNDKELENNLDK